MRYRQPRSINIVTFLFVALIAMGVYLLVCLWPVYSTSAHAKSILLDHLPILYKANLRPDEVAYEMIDAMKNNIAAELQKIGINDKATKIIIHRNPKEVSIEAQFKLKAHLPFPDRTYEFQMSPRVVTDAARFDL